VSHEEMVKSLQNWNDIFASKKIENEIDVFFENLIKKVDEEFMEETQFISKKLLKIKFRR
jgi:hypothetical protein